MFETGPLTTATVTEDGVKKYTRPSPQKKPPIEWRFSAFTQRAMAG